MMYRLMSNDVTVTKKILNMVVSFGVISHDIFENREFITHFKDT